MREYWVHHLDPIAIHLWEGFGIRWYGLAYAAAFIVAALLLRLYHRKGRFAGNSDQQLDLLFRLILGVLIGGRLGYVVLYEPGIIINRPWEIIALWKGGMASHGGFIGVAIAAWFSARKLRMDFWRLADILATLAPPGLALGRIANFINGELWGRTTTVPWAVIFPKSAAPGTPITAIPPRHPSQLYAAALEGVVPLLWVHYRFWKSPAVRNYSGQLAGEFLILYSIMRMVTEQFREPDASLLLGMTRGTAYSLILLVSGIGLVICARRRNHPPAEEQMGGSTRP